MKRPTRADAAYMAVYRAEHPDYERKSLERHKARSRALTRLAARFPKEFGRYYKEECDAIGVPLPKTVKT